MFGRTEKSTPAPTPAEEQATADKKGRPTPSRKEAQAAARERARAGMDKKSAQKLLREKQGVSNKRMREGMKNGEEKYLPARDQGPVKRFVRDWVDSRLRFTELVLPALILLLVLSAVAPEATNGLQLGVMVLLLLDVITMRFSLRRALKEKFPDESTKGTTFYALTRMLQLRFMRLPKPKVKIGGDPV